jgi:hypothetical protein
MSARDPQLRPIRNNESLCPDVAGPLRCDVQGRAGSQIGRLPGEVRHSAGESVCWRISPC